MEKMKVLIMGTGRMGSIIASGINERCEIFVYDENEEKGRDTASKVGGTYAPSSKVTDCKVLILALPPKVTADALKNVDKYLNKDTVVINIATTVLKNELKPVCSYPENLVGAKMVTHYREMNESPVIIVDAESEKSLTVAKEIFSVLGQVVEGDESQVEEVNTLATREAFRAGLRIQKILSKKGFTDEVINSAIRAAAAGSIKSYAYNDIGPFALELLAELEKEEKL
ncbi:MAG: NAD(P)-binding domain-containing protein [Clostridiales bacterium]|nr:NAD(P)-binding domain-containing protein [Clostridiales bacterium]MCF8023249.1 NAD(P)-binding domain-containing protein [Clostridiales bacterium]